MSGDGRQRKAGKRRNSALVDYGRRQSAQNNAAADGVAAAPRKRSAVLLWLGLTLAGIAIFALVRSPAI